VHAQGAFEIITSKQGLTRIKKIGSLIGIIHQGSLGLVDAAECISRLITLDVLCEYIPE
jgi:hypothetical protein